MAGGLVAAVVLFEVGAALLVYPKVDLPDVGRVPLTGDGSGASAGLTEPGSGAVAGRGADEEACCAMAGNELTADTRLSATEIGRFLLFRLILPFQDQ
jgi:hypothetical protein